MIEETTQKALPENVQAQKDRDGDVIAVSTGGTEIYFRLPREEDLERFVDAAAKSPSRATKDLVVGLCLTQDALAAARKADPGFILKCGTAVMEMSGLNQGLTAKKA